MTTPIEKYWHGTEYNDCPPELGITIKRANVTGLYARCVVIHLLTRAENQGNHNLYMDVIDRDNHRLNNTLLLGRNNNISLQARIDKPPTEFGTNFAMYNQDTDSCWVAEIPGIGFIPSDTVSNFSTRWGGPIVGGNDYGHVSYYVIFQVGGNTPPIPPISPSDCAEARAELARVTKDYDTLLAGVRELAK